LPSRNVIEPVATRLAQALAAAARTPGGGGRAPGDVAATAQQLGKLVLQPLSKAIGSRNLAIVADGALTGVPFAMLSIADNGTALGTHRQLVRLPSIASLMVLRRRPAVNADGVAIVGEPVLRADDPRLGSDAAAAPAAAADTSATVASTLDPAKVDKLLGFDASRAGLRQQDWHGTGTLHIATPTVLNLAHPNHSGIVLSLYEVGGQAQNGFLKAGDIAAMKLPVDLVVLADTAVAAGDGAQAEDPYALASAFMSAGARRVLSGLWRLEPVAAQAFMQRFYTALAVQHLAAPAALQAAQSALQQDSRWSSPATWAAYELEGDWR
jgi:CHAT domain-containing protein